MFGKDLTGNCKRFLSCFSGRFLFGISLLLVVAVFAVENPRKREKHGSFGCGHKRGRFTEVRKLERQDYWVFSNAFSFDHQPKYSHQLFFFIVILRLCPVTQESGSYTAAARFLLPFFNL